MHAHINEGEILTVNLQYTIHYIFKSMLDGYESVKIKKKTLTN